MSCVIVCESGDEEVCAMLVMKMLPELSRMFEFVEDEEQSLLLRETCRALESVVSLCVCEMCVCASVCV